MQADLQLFWQELTRTDSLVLATSKDDVVTIRPVSGLRQGNEIVFCTNHTSRKAAQILANPNVGVCLGTFYLQGRARILGGLQSPETAALRSAYAARYPGAFENGSEFTADSIFIAITITKLNQWLVAGEGPDQLAESLL